MHIARSTLDNLTYQANQFATLPSSELNFKRNNLLCPGCGVPAFFRQASQMSGRAACFGARPHASGCHLAAPEFDRKYQEDDDGYTQSELGNLSKRIVLDLNFGAAPKPSINSQDGVITDVDDCIGGSRLNGSHRHEVTLRRLRPLLKALTKSAHFNNSTQLIEIPNRSVTTVADFFVNFNNIGPNHEGQYHGFWGMVTNAQFGNAGTLWLNAGGWNDVSICLPYEFGGVVCERFGIKEPEELSGAFVLILGEIRVANNGKRCLKLHGIDLITIDLP